jgi:hypothetical protein
MVVVVVLIDRQVSLSYIIVIIIIIGRAAKIQWLVLASQQRQAMKGHDGGDGTAVDQCDSAVMSVQSRDVYCWNLTSRVQNCRSPSVNERKATFAVERREVVAPWPAGCNTTTAISIQYCSRSSDRSSLVVFVVVLLT